MKKKMNKKSVTVKKAALATMCLACVLSVSACGKKDNRNENKDPITGESQTQSNDGNGSEAGTDGSNEGGSDTAAGDHSEFEAMIGDENTDPNSIIDYINTNIAGAAVSDVKNFFTGLLGFGDDIRNIDFTRLEDSRKYMPEDMIAFMDLMRLEGDTPSMLMSDEENRKVINMTLSEMLERALLFEQHLEKYPNSVSTDAAARMYEEIATNAISGGYNKEEGVEHYYKGDANDIIDQKALQYYQQFVQANPNSNLAKIVTEYMNVLQSNDFKINDSMEDFYKGLHGKLNVSNLTNHGANTGTNGAGNGSMNNSTESNTENSSMENSNTETSSVDNTNTAKNDTNAVDTVIQGTVNR
ncbi:MAG: hypothetical protein K2O40_05755 [Lachnospiraceae bacterium]|nr:hypothetical protein [Lachnospiraceae bacterium]MDE7183978.1 hypothetical protein [Lachnospiraceae bacterium]